MKCEKCRREQSIDFRAVDHHLCDICFDKWMKFLNPYRSQLRKFKTRKRWDEFFEVIFKKFLDNKEVVNFT